MYTENASNYINCIGILWTVCHLWPSRDSFVYNCYCNWSYLVLQNGNGTASFLQSREGVTQGDTLAMAAYVIGILLLIKWPEDKFPYVTHPWYTDNDDALGTFTGVELYFNSLKQFGPERGYYPEPSKCVMIVHPDNVDHGKRFVLCCGFNLCNGVHYLGRFIRGNGPKWYWLKLRTKTWEQNITNISKTVVKYTQESYAAVVRALQL